MAKAATGLPVNVNVGVSDGNVTSVLTTSSRKVAVAFRNGLRSTPPSVCALSGSSCAWESMNTVCGKWGSVRKTGRLGDSRMSKVAACADVSVSVRVCAEVLPGTNSSTWV